jgi:hypothetical protein
VDPSTAAWLAALALTVGVETPVALLVDPARSRLALDVPLANLVTHPLAWAARGALGAPWLATELAVAAAEAAVFRVVTGLPAGRAVRLALVVNAATAALSLLSW